MELKQRLMERAQALGFAQMRIIRPERLVKWEAVALALGLDLSKRCVDPRDVMPECRSVVQLVYPYRPFELEPALAAPSAYYIASNASSAHARALAEWLTEQGFAATSDTKLPEKALAERAGGGRYGRNGIISAGALGTRIALRSILTDAEMEPDEPYDGDDFADACRDCADCVAACPVGALDGTGHVDTALCLRARPDSEPLDRALRPLIGHSMLGCDLCQDCCPRNRAVPRTPVPDDVRAAFEIKKLLAGDMDGIAEQIGSNYARKKRVQARACYVTANLDRADCADALIALTRDDSELVRDAAAWALESLRR